MVAGNIPCVTQTLPTAIYVAVSNGESGLAWAWTAVIILFSWLLLAASRNGAEQRKRQADLTGAQCLHMLRIELVSNHIENKAQHIVERMEEA
ncbi:hypothetical protein [Paenibacillus lautus]|uniref:hypothetical protein n=1 Tax=Paenibacillus lautus TaxID=1401 RepID=UPI003D9AA1D2